MLFLMLEAPEVGEPRITEYTITYQGRPAYTGSIIEFRKGRVVHETQYFADPCNPSIAILQRVNGDKPPMREAGFL